MFNREYKWDLDKSSNLSKITVFKEAPELKHRAKGPPIPCSNTLGLGSVGEERKKYKQPFEKYREMNGWK